MTWQPANSGAVGNAACPFCARIGASGTALAVAFDDDYPVSPGHRLVVPREHVERLEDLDDAHWDAVFKMVRAEAKRLTKEGGADGVNIGVNSGGAAGQTVDHAHVHVIPRHAGDVDDPRGGVRWVIPARADYWRSS